MQWFTPHVALIVVSILVVGLLLFIATCARQK